jgi:hypothetical protein
VPGLALVDLKGPRLDIVKIHLGDATQAWQHDISPIVSEYFRMFQACPSCPQLGIIMIAIAAIIYETQQAHKLHSEIGVQHDILQLDICQEYSSKGGETVPNH